MDIKKIGVLYSLFVYMARLFSGLSAFFSMAILAHISPVEVVAEFSYGFVLILILSIFGQFGFPQLIVSEVVARKECGENEYREFAFWGGVLVIFMSMVSGVLFYLFVGWDFFGVRGVLSNESVIVCAISSVFYALQIYFAEVFRANNRIVLATVFGGVVLGVVNLSILSILFFSNESISGVTAIIIYCVSCAVSVILSVCWLIKYGFLRCSLSGIKSIFSKVMLRRSVSNLSISLFSSLIIQAAPLLVGALGSAKEIADFAIANRIASVLAMAGPVVAQVFIRDIAKYFALMDIKSVQKIATESSRLLFLIVFIPSLIIFAFGNVVVEVFFGLKYVGCIFYLKLLTAGFLINSLFGIRGQYFIQSGFELPLVKIDAAYLVIVYPICALMGSFFGVQAIVYVSVIGIIFLAVTECIVLRLNKNISSFVFDI